MMYPALIYGMALAELLATAHISTRFSPGDSLRDEIGFVHLEGRRTMPGPFQYHMVSILFFWLFKLRRGNILCTDVFFTLQLFILIVFQRSSLK